MKQQKSIYLGFKRRWRIKEYAIVSFLFGGIGYGLLEVIWRGYTHPSMVLTGGLCFSIIFFFNRKWMRMPLFIRSLFCTLLVVAVEFCVGIVVNCILHLDVWDYSDERFHLFGQICAEYTIFWFLLCTALSFILTAIFRKEKT